MESRLGLIRTTLCRLKPCLRSPWLGARPEVRGQGKPVARLTYITPALIHIHISPGRHVWDQNSPGTGTLIWHEKAVGRFPIPVLCHRRQLYRNFAIKIECTPASSFHLHTPTSQPRYFAISHYTSCHQLHFMARLIHRRDEPGDYIYVGHMFLNQSTPLGSVTSRFKAAAGRLSSAVSLCMACMGLFPPGRVKPVRG